MSRQGLGLDASFPARQYRCVADCGSASPVDHPSALTDRADKEAAMNLLAGTSKGLFAVEDSREPVAVLPERSVRALAHARDRIFAGADTGLFASDDRGASWTPSGVGGRVVWDILPGPDRDDPILVGT